MPLHDVVLIGAGPAGLAAAAHLLDASLDLVHLEEGPLAQTIDRYPPGVRLYSPRRDLEFAGVPFGPDPDASPTREAYLAYLAQVAATLDHDLRLHSPATALHLGGDGEPHRVAHTGPHGASGVLRAQNVVVASGGYYRPIRLDIPGEDRDDVSHYYRGAADAAGRRILVCGGRNSAVEAAVELAEAGATVRLVYRGARLPRARLKPWLLPGLDAARRAGTVKVIYRSVPSAIGDRGVALQQTGADGTTRTWTEPADLTYLLTGYGPDLDLLRAAGVPVHRRTGRPLFDPDTLQTRTAGVFLCGTVVLKRHGEKATIANTRGHGERIARNLRRP